MEQEKTTRTRAAAPRRRQVLVSVCRHRQDQGALCAWFVGYWAATSENTFCGVHGSDVVCARPGVWARRQAHVAVEHACEKAVVR
jgi:hypothetical protein